MVTGVIRASSCMVSNLAMCSQERPVDSKINSTSQHETEAVSSQHETASVWWHQWLMSKLSSALPFTWSALLCHCLSAHARFHHTRSSERLCARSPPLNAVRPEVFLAFVSPPHKFRGTGHYHNLAQQSSRQMIIISKSAWRNVKCDNMWDMYRHYIRWRESVNSCCAAVSFCKQVWTGHKCAHAVIF